MVFKKRQGKTPLTEPQAKALADWWGGHYQKTTLTSEQGIQVLHGVTIRRSHAPDAGKPSSSRGPWWFLEEAREAENSRHAINPGAEDWVG